MRRLSGRIKTARGLGFERFIGSKADVSSGLAAESAAASATEAELSEAAEAASGAMPVTVVATIKAAVKAVFG